MRYHHPLLLKREREVLKREIITAVLVGINNNDMTLTSSQRKCCPWPGHRYPSEERTYSAQIVHRTSLSGIGINKINK